MSIRGQRAWATGDVKYQRGALLATGTSRPTGKDIGHSPGLEFRVTWRR